MININEAHYSLRAKEKALINYQEFFNVKGSIIGTAKEKLFNSLLLMRIFFEVNRNKEVNALELRNAEIYKQYVKQTTANILEQGFDIDFKKILEQLTKLMIERNSYDGVPISDLCFTVLELNKFKSILDENIIINKKIKTGAGITEAENDFFLFCL